MLENTAFQLEKYELNLRKIGRLPATIESYCRDAKNFLHFCTPLAKSLAHIDVSFLQSYYEYLTHIQKEKVNSIRRNIIAIRQFFRYLAEINEIKESPFEKFILPQRQDDIPSPMDLNDLDYFIEIASSEDHIIKSVRDPAILALFGLEGLKATELINLKWPDFIPLQNWGSLRIIGTNSRIIQLSGETTKLLNALLKCMRTFHHTKYTFQNEGYMFIAFKGRDGMTPIPQISRHGIKFMLYEVGQKAKVPGLNSELLRQYAIAHLVQLGRTSEEIMEHFGRKQIGKIGICAQLYRAGVTQKIAKQSNNHE